MKYEQWNLRAPGSPAARRRIEQAGLPPLCAAVLCARGLDTPDRALAFLAHDTDLLHDPFLLRDMDRAAARVTAALEGGETIAVYGDYDVDGITSTALLTDFLKTRGGRVVSYIPDRMEEGYGLNPDAIRRLGDRGVSLIVTVDCGITAVAEVDYARTLGLDVVVTDQGVAVNPRRPELAEKLKKAGIKVYTIQQLKEKAEALVGKPDPIRYKERIVGVVMYRDNTVVDVIRQIEED